MKRFTITSLMLLVASFLVLPQVFAQTPDDLLPQNLDKRAQTGFKFLSVSVDARAAAMADALTALDNLGATAMFYNPSSMANLQKNIDISFGQVRWISDITYNMAAAAFRTKVGIFGVNLTAIDYGEFLGTIRDPSSTAGYLDTGDFSPSALAVGLGYAIAISDKFSVGAGAKYVHQDLGTALISRGDDFDPNDPLNGNGGETASFKESTIAFDFGIMYRTGYKSLNFAMSVRNFSGEITYVRESFELPLTFNIGVSMDLLNFTQADPERHSLLFTLDTTKPRDFDSNLRIGGEYTLLNLVHLRAGYVTPTDEQGVQLGAGLSTDLGTLGFALDYAYSDFGVFDTVNRFSARLSF